MQLKKKDAQPFRIPKDINFMLVDTETGSSPNTNTKSVIYESFKPKDYFVADLEKISNKDRLGLYDSKNEEIILRFY